MKESLVIYLEAHLKFQETWVAKGAILERQWHSRKGTTYLADTVSRKLRSLEEASIIAVKPFGASVAYRWLPPDKRDTYIRTTDRLPGKENQLFR